MDHPLPAVSMSNAGKQPYHVVVKSSTGFVAVKNFNGKTEVYPAAGNTAVTIPASPEIVMWSCNQDSPSIANGDILALDCSENQICALDVTTLSSLKELNCSRNRLSRLFLFGPADIPFFSGPRDLQVLDCSQNSIAELDLSGLKQLQKVNCSHNRIQAIRLAKNIQSLDCSNNCLSVIDLAGLAALQFLNAADNSFHR
jgi:Leucine-rich repeat (LRR) protein